MASRPYKLVALQSLAWWRYGSAYATEEAALRGIARRIETGEFRVYDDGRVVTPGLGCEIGLIVESGALSRLRVVDGKVELR